MIEVRIDSSRPIFIKANADDFGRVFSTMNSGEQVAVFRAIVEHMRPHRLQWDYIAIQLREEENRDVAETLSECLQFALEAA